MKIGLDLVVNKEPDGRVFINYWDWKNGKDICCQIEGDKLYILDNDDNNEILKEEISLSNFVSLVKQSNI